MNTEETSNSNKTPVDSGKAKPRLTELSHGAG